MTRDSLGGAKQGSLLVAPFRHFLSFSPRPSSFFHFKEINYRDTRAADNANACDKYPQDIVRDDIFNYEKERYIYFSNSLNIFCLFCVSIKFHITCTCVCLFFFFLI